MQFGNRDFFNTASTFGKALTTINAQVDEAAMFDRGTRAPAQMGPRRCGWAAQCGGQKRSVRFFCILSERSLPMQVREIMHKGVEWVAPNTPVAVLAKKMSDRDIGAIPVGENDRLIGMVTDRDIAVRAVANGKDVSKLTARDVMTSGVIYCRDTEDVDDAARVMESKQIRRLPVINGNKRMVGMLSLGDISHAALLSTAGEVIRAVSAHHA
jgi:CBS domain-containing protein